MAAFIRLPYDPIEADTSEVELPTDSHLPLPDALIDFGDAPAMCLIVSGGHTELVLARRLDKRASNNPSPDQSLDFQLVGETRDDAAGEAFDKAARAIGLPYPGGPAIQKSAEHANEEVKPLPRAWLPGTHEFSFSGLKTAVLNRAREMGIYPRTESDPPPDEQTQADIAKAFQDSAVDVLVTKTIRAAEEFNCSAIVLVGGVAANRPLRETMRIKSPFPRRYATDTALHRQRRHDRPRRLGPLLDRRTRHIRPGCDPIASHSVDYAACDPTTPELRLTKRDAVLNPRIASPSSI